MKYKSLILFLVLTLGAGFAQADKKGMALTVCKSHIADLYDGSQQTRIKKIRKRSGYVEVKMKVSAAGDQFNALCLVTNDGHLSYSTDRVLEVSKVSKVSKL